MNYNDIRIGQEAFLSTTITKKDVEDFASLSGDYNSIHTKGDMPIVHGALLMSYISALIGTQLPGDGTIWSSFKISFISPCYINDTIALIGRVNTKNATWRSIDLHIDGIDSEGNTLFYATATVKC